MHIIEGLCDGACQCGERTLCGWKVTLAYGSRAWSSPGRAEKILSLLITDFHVRACIDMPSKSKSIFRQPGAQHFQLVHRSQRDPLINDPDASQHVLKPVVRENAKKVIHFRKHCFHLKTLPPGKVESRFGGLTFSIRYHIWAA
jgi:hypothetical protein